jgi:hypothetical protein
MCLICLIPDTLVEMLSPALGPAVLHWGANVATDHVSSLEIQPWSDLWYTSIIWSYAGHAESRYVPYSFKRLIPLAPTNKESAWINEEKTFTGKIVSQLSANDVTHAVSLDTNNQA